MIAAGREREIFGSAAFVIVIERAHKKACVKEL